MKATRVSVGIHADTGAEAGTTMATIGAVHEFGATINHPGGTRYVYAGPGKARFVKNSFVGPVMGVTRPHKIVIPERSFLRKTFGDNKQQYQQNMRQIIKSAVSGKRDVKAGMGLLGRKAEQDVKKTMVDLKSPPNKPSTIAKKKGANNPLVDTGRLQQSIRWDYARPGQTGVNNAD